MPSGWTVGHIEFGYPFDVPTEWLLLRVVRPYAPSLKRMQPMEETDDADPVIYNKGVDIENTFFNIKMTKAERDTLETWLKTKTDFKMNQVWLKDPFGVEHTARIMNGEYNPPEQGYNNWRYQLNVRME